MPWIEKEGRTVEEARAAALAELGLPEEEAEIEVIREGARGLFGLGGEPALVRVRPRSEAPDLRAAFRDAPLSPVDVPAAPPQPVAAPEQAPAAGPGAPQPGGPAVSLSERQRITQDVAVEMVKGILERMGLKGDVRTRVAGGTVYVEVFGEEMGILIGRGGKTLEALQELVRAGVQRRLKARPALVVDVEAYWERRRQGRRGEPGRREGSRAQGGR